MFIFTGKADIKHKILFTHPVQGGISSSFFHLTCSVYKVQRLEPELKAKSCTVGGFHARHASGEQCVKRREAILNREWLRNRQPITIIL